MAYNDTCEINDTLNADVLEQWQFHHYADTPNTVLMREVYSGMYISWDWLDRTFRLMPDYQNDFPGIMLPHKSISHVVAMVVAMGGDW